MQTAITTKQVFSLSNSKTKKVLSSLMLSNFQSSNTWYFLRLRSFVLFSAALMLDTSYGALVK
jgi:hypothetical protein